MTLWTLARVWRLLMGGAVVLVALGAVVALGDHEIFVPSADGLRYARQFAVAWLPVFLGACLMEPVPELSGTLSRGARVQRWLRFALLLGSVLPLLPAWMGGLDPARALYDVFQLGVLISVSVMTVSRWGIFGVLGTAMVSVIWLLAGDSLAVMMGFFDPYMEAFVRPPTWSAQALTLATAAVAVLTVFSPWESR